MSYQQKQIPRSVFRAYDIRGIIGKELDEGSFYCIGLAIACYLQKLNRQQIFVARDGRLTSFALAMALKKGLLDGGIDIIDLGAVATPVMYYATHTQGIDSGLMITGSHNPADYNGIKLVLAGKTLTHEEIDTLYALLDEAKPSVCCGEETSFDVIEDYIQRILSDIRLKRPLKVVVDCGNGVAGPVIPRVISKLGCEVIPLYCEIDGRFPNHHPDPSIEANLVDLKAAVANHQADIGLGFDGDADRLGLVTNKGEVIWPDRLMMFYSREILSRNQGATVVFDVKCSSHLEKEIQAAGGVARMCPTGHSIVKAVMKKEQAILAGEMSGHLFFKDRWYGFDDALYSACRLLEIISSSHLTVSEQFELIPNSVNTPEIKIAITDEEKFDFIQRFTEQADFPEGRVLNIDGLRVEFPNGWGLLRASNTTPCLVARFEATDKVHLEQIQDLFKKQIQRLDSELDLPF
ncbi:TPA: phosphomannomutase/phosphoglucomutase [Legionella pneumophila]|nr:phosphomannomutase/phosphoglucomutase [Legionella pneumophila]HAU1320680.1 phosphomannomutase/phosphoglucomutase [Legionella pneumophila]HBC0468518.1 phosphomannomutase/phosphoglucomutase [Legionella pneumophila]HBD9374886.1 phosphomannomutase/phosphoglucomutase [Legionella pneumophila]HBI2946310.1 phosphomannomutase/phosphoglucomutase [Legionella pneumophila]